MVQRYNMPRPNRKTASIRTELIDRLDKVARRKDRSRAYELERAVENYLAQEENPQ